MRRAGSNIGHRVDLGAKYTREMNDRKRKEVMDDPCPSAGRPLPSPHCQHLYLTLVLLSANPFVPCIPSATSTISLHAICPSALNSKPTFGSPSSCCTSLIP
jgi:hypothetical protein